MEREMGSRRAMEGGGVRGVYLGFEKRVGDSGRVGVVAVVWNELW